MPRLDAIRRACRELDAVHESWMREFCTMHSTLGQEDLLRVAREIEDALTRVTEATRPAAGEASI